MQYTLLIVTFTLAKAGRVTLSDLGVSHSNIWLYHKPFHLNVQRKLQHVLFIFGHMLTAIHSVRMRYACFLGDNSCTHSSSLPYHRSRLQHTQSSLFPPKWLGWNAWPLHHSKTRHLGNHNFQFQACTIHWWQQKWRIGHTQCSLHNGRGMGDDPNKRDQHGSSFFMEQNLHHCGPSSTD